MIKVGINGFGRIGKCILLQLLNNIKFNICCINVLNITLNEIEDYLKYDSTHSYDKNFNVTIISDTEIKINHHHIHIFSDRNAKNLEWKKFGCKYIFDATGSYLTLNKCSEHDVDYVVMTAPSKDNTPTFIYGVNHNNYNGENIISGSSCTTNCLAPMLKILNDEYKIKNCIFTTIHATTASQYTVDIVNKLSRTNRSIFNNIIPHTTGASSSITSVLPELNGKINGTSIRVPVLNCSLLDVNIELENKNITLKDIKKLLINSSFYKSVYDINEKKLVSCDFITTTTPTILDINASIDIGNGIFKLFIWYDNEWSYSAQLIKMVDLMFEYNNSIKDKYFIENIDMKNKGVVCRCDFNVPTVNNTITDDFRIISSIETIKTILSNNPKYIILTSHFGRPKNKEAIYSLNIILPLLNKYLDRKIIFLEDGISKNTLNIIKNNTENTNEIPIYLLENLRYHDQESNYENYCDDDEIINMYKDLGNVFINDAFGCVHRKHMSIYAIKTFYKTYGYGYLIKKEIEMMNNLLQTKNKKILCIIGGNKLKDKLPIIDSFRKINNSTIYIGGGLAKQYVNKTSNVIKMKDGYGNVKLDFNSNDITYINDINNSELCAFDIGTHSLNELYEIIDNNDIIFWNGPLGVIEHNSYKIGSVNIINYLLSKKDKTIIIGGGETASLIDKECIIKNDNKNVYISTGGGALLEYLENKIMNGKNIVGLDIFV
jgi:glyceraldehyde 3-phosphate dehydrogenase